MSVDRDLLFGLIACQMGFVSRDDLFQRTQSWRKKKESGFGEFLVTEEILGTEDQAAIDGILSRVLDRGGDSTEFLSSPSTNSLIDDLREIDDTDHQQSLSSITMTHDHTPQDKTRDFQGLVGDITRNELLAHGAPRFQVLRHHASGGLGRVSIARDQELNRDVALKEIQDNHAENMTSRSRFLLEAEVTGGLEHPGIVPVYSLGQNENGRPYYAMRFIRGESLKEAINEFHTRSGANAMHAGDLVLRQLLARFVDVCNAVEYAHSRGVLHRDIKPSNIMLGKFGETLVVDWGLAKPQGKADDEESAEAPLMPTSQDESSETMDGAALGTPSYMSPEQAEGKIDQLESRSDVYSLGATLYCLLTNHAPFEGETLRDTLDLVKYGQFSAPRQLNPHVPGALDAICTKAMALDPDDRYSSAAKLAEEIESWMADEPVEAWPEPFFVRARRWIKRHQTFVVGTSAAVVVAVVGLVVGLTALASTNRQLDTAKTALQLKNDALQSSIVRVEQAESDTRIEAAKSAAVNDFLVNKLLASASPNQALGRKITVEEIVDTASEEIETAFVEQPDVEAEVRTMLADVYNSLAIYDSAQVHLVVASRLYETLQDDRLLAETKSALGLVLLEKGEYDEAARFLKESAEIAERIFGSEHPETLTCWNNFALVYQAKGDWDLAEKELRRVLEVRLRVLGEDHEHTVASLSNLGLLLRELNKLEESESLFKRAIEANKRIFSADHPVSLTLLNNSALTLQAANKLTEAEKASREVLERRTRVLGVDHHHTLISMGNLGHMLGQKGALPEAEPLLKKAVEGLRIKLGHEHPDTLTAMNNYGLVLSARGKQQEAEELYKQLVAARIKVLGPEHEQTIMAEANLGNLLRERGKFAESLPLLRESSAAAMESLGPEHPLTTTVRNNLALLLHSMNQIDEAEKLYRETLEIRRRTIGADHPDTIVSLGNLGMLLRSRGKQNEALEMVRESFERSRKVLGLEHPFTLTSMNNYALILQGLSRLGEAEKLYRELFERRNRVLGKNHPDALVTALNYASLLVTQDKLDDAEKLLDSTAAGLLAAAGPDHAYTLSAMNMQAQIHQSRGDWDAAEAIFRKVLASRRRTLGEQHPATIASTLGLARSLKELKKLAEAEMLVRQTLRAVETAVGKQHVQTVLLRKNLSYLLHAQDKLEEAADVVRGTLELLQAAGPEANTNIVGTQEELSAILLDQRKANEAIPLLESAYTVRKEADPLTRSGTMALLGWAYIQSDRAKEAEPLLRECLEMRRAALPAEHWLVANTESMLGSCLTGLERYEEAEKLLVPAYERLKQAKGATPKRRRQALTRIIQFYESWGKPDEVEKWKTEQGGKSSSTKK